MNMTVWEWFEQRSYHHRDFAGLALSSDTRAERPSTTLIFPARNVAGTIGSILSTVAAPAGQDRASSIRSSSSMPTPRTARPTSPAPTASRSSRRTSSCPATAPRRARATRCGARCRRRPRRHRHVRRRRYHRLRGALRLRHPRPDARGPSHPVRQGRLPAAVQAGRGADPRRRRPGHRADGQAAAQPLLPGAGGLRAAARGRVRRPPGAARQRALLHRLRGRDRHDDRRLRADRPGQHGPGRPRHPAEPAPAAGQPDPDVLGGAQDGGRARGPGRGPRRRRPRGGARPVGAPPAGHLPARGGDHRRPPPRRAPERAGRAPAAGPPHRRRHASAPPPSQPYPPFVGPPRPKGGRRTPCPESVLPRQ